MSEDAFEVAAQMVDGFEHQRWIVRGLGQHERTLEHRLGVASQTGRADLDAGTFIAFARSLPGEINNPDRQPLTVD